MVPVPVHTCQVFKHQMPQNSKIKKDFRCVHIYDSCICASCRLVLNSRQNVYTIYMYVDYKQLYIFLKEFVQS